jgi:hypothetical protein
MRPRMEDDLRMFSELAKQEQAAKAENPERPPETGDKPAGVGTETSQQEVVGLTAVVDYHLERAARRQQTDTETQQEIFDIQKEKQAVMNRLKERLRCLDDADCDPDPGEGEDRAVFEQKRRKFTLTDPETGEKSRVTFGDLVTDLEWGITHHLEKGRVPRLLAKKYLLEQAKQELRGLLDEQIVASESASDNVHEWKQDAYRRHQEDIESGVAEKRSGLLAERMVKGMLKKASLDDGDLPFELLEADIYQDVEEKIDFIIRRKGRHRGVEVEADEKAKDIGIQFTTNPRAADKKQRQVSRARQRLLERGDMDDLVLVVMPVERVQALKHEWEDAGRPSGGPDKLMKRSEAETLFAGVMKDVLAPEEIKAAWAKLAPRFGE